MHPYRSAAPILGPPPRDVPRGVRLRLSFGGLFGILGWSITAFGSIFAWVFVGQSEFVTMGWFAGGSVRVPGVVVATDRTSMQENDSYVFSVDATFTPEGGGGGERRVRSFTLGAVPRVGDAVTVEHEPGRPERARIAGLRTRPFHRAVAFVFLLPLVGLGLAAVQLVRGRRAAALLRTGRVAAGTFVEKHETGTRVNKRMVYRMIFEFEDERGHKRRAEARTHRPELLEDDTAEQLLYDVLDPAKATLIDHLPGAPRVDASGRIIDRGGLGVVGAMALPGLTVLVNLVAWLVS